MKILLLAPHPFYQERGTPIAVNLLLEALSGLGHTVDVLTYHEGEDKTYPGVTIHRIRRPPFSRQVPPGPSLKKILCDLVMFPHALRMARTGRYDLVHAVEESVYMAMRIKRRHGVPYLYDMDSSLARQVAEKFGFLKFMLPLMTRIERSAICGAMAVVPVCDTLADLANAEGSRKTILLRDISLLRPSCPEDTEAVRTLIPRDGQLCLMYVGNLETYQGADLMLEGFGVFLKKGGKGRLVIAGGKAEDILKYRAKSATMGIHGQVQFLGPQPLGRMAALFEAADILLSPRIKGNNTPMKIYSYLASGKAILATALPTHTQVLTDEVARLVPPDPVAFGEAMLQLAENATLRTTLGRTAGTLAEHAYSPAAFHQTVSALYDWVEEERTP
jgi:glycosyltransferase involved in cell wall biosynthesis